MIPANLSVDPGLLATWGSAWLLSYALHSTVLIGTAWLLVRTLRPSPAWRDSIWKVALIGGVVTATWQISAWGEEPLAGRHDLSASAERVGASFLDAVSHQDRSPVGWESILVGDVPAVVIRSPLEPVEGRTVEDAVLFTDASPSGPSPWFAPVLEAVAGTSVGRWSQLLLGLWVAGAAWGLCRVVRARIRLARLLRGRRAVEEGTVTRLLDVLCRDGGWDHPVRLTVSRRLQGPVALARGEICLPTRALTRLTSEQQQSVLAHELAHLIRRDPEWRAAGGFFEGIFFFQPLNRVARRGLQESAEFLCDDWAVDRTGQHLTLAKCLVEVAGWLHPRPGSLLASGMSELGSPLVRRVERLLQPPRRRLDVSPGWRMAVCSALLVLTVGVAPAITPGSVPEPAAALAAVGPCAVAPEPRVVVETGDLLVSPVPAPPTETPRAPTALHPVRVVPEPDDLAPPAPPAPVRLRAVPLPLLAPEAPGPPVVVELRSGTPAVVAPGIEGPDLDRRLTPEQRAAVRRALRGRLGSVGAQLEELEAELRVDLLPYLKELEVRLEEELEPRLRELEEQLRQLETEDGELEEIRLRLRLLIRPHLEVLRDLRRETSERRAVRDRFQRELERRETESRAIRNQRRSVRSSERLSRQI